MPTKEMSSRKSPETKRKLGRSVRRQLKEFRLFWLRYKRNRAAVFGLVITLSLAVIGVLAPFITRNGPWDLVTDGFISPNATYPMGTDDLGRDILSQVLYGVGVSMTVGLSAAALSLFMGSAIGAISGYYGGLVDEAAMRVTEVFMVIPRFFFAVIIVATLRPGIWLIIFVIAILSWPPNARLIRAEFLSLREREFVEASRAIGAGNLTIIGEILPNAMPPVIVNSSLQIAQAILVEAGLSFLGLGDPNVMSLGYIIQNAQKFIFYAGYMAVFPGIFISLMVLGFNLIGDGLNEALNPRLRSL